MGVFGPQRCDVAVCLFATLFHLFNHSCTCSVQHLTYCWPPGTPRGPSLTSCVFSICMDH
jgi:hypothetical protein